MLYTTFNCIRRYVAPAASKAPASDAKDRDGEAKRSLRDFTIWGAELNFLPPIHPTQRPGRCRQGACSAPGVQRVERPFSRNGTRTGVWVEALHVIFKGSNKTNPLKEKIFTSKL